jgi:hypothetical protein
MEVAAEGSHSHPYWVVQEGEAAVVPPIVAAEAAVVPSVVVAVRAAEEALQVPGRDSRLPLRLLCHKKAKQSYKKKRVQWVCETSSKESNNNT